MKSIYKNNKIKFLILGLVVICAVSFGALIQGCSQEDDLPVQKISKEEQLLNLTAPSGEKIADNIGQLKDLVSVFVAEKFEIDKEFYLTSLDYMPLEKGYIVLIKYKTFDNEVGGIVRTNNTSLLTVDPKSTVKVRNNVRLKSDIENSAIFNGITYTCSGSCICMPTFTKHDSDNGYNVSCTGSCACSLTVTL